MERHIFAVYGSSVPQGRPRFFRRGDYVGTYDPDKSRDWKQTIQAQVLNTLGGRAEIHEGAIKLQIMFYLPRPKSLPKKVKHHIKRPDVDNLAKSVKDALRGILYRDDSQIVDLYARKEYTETPRVIISLETIE